MTAVLRTSQNCSNTSIAISWRRGGRRPAVKVWFEVEGGLIASSGPRAACSMARAVIGRSVTWSVPTAASGRQYGESGDRLSWRQALVRERQAATR
jgi:hypothetical protein